MGEVFDKIGADRMADEVDVLIRRKVIDTRSPAADALLDYREPPTSPRSDRMAQLETRVEELGASLRRMAAETPYPEESTSMAGMISEIGTLRARVKELELLNALADRAVESVRDAVPKLQLIIDDQAECLAFIDNHAFGYTQSATERADASGDLRRSILREIRDAARGTLPGWAKDGHMFLRSEENSDG